jgi:hypothetical protein
MKSNYCFHYFEFFNCLSLLCIILQINGIIKTPTYLYTSTLYAIWIGLMGYEKSWATQSHSPLYNFLIDADIPRYSIALIWRGVEWLLNLAYTWDSCKNKSQEIEERKGWPTTLAMILENLERAYIQLDIDEEEALT